MPWIFARWSRTRIVLLVLAAGIFLSTVVALWNLSARVSSLRQFRSATAGWTFPSRVYSDWIDLDPRRAWPRRYVESSLELRGYESSRPPLERPGTMASDGNTLVVFLRGFAYPESTVAPAQVRLDFARGILEKVSVAPGGPRVARIEPILLRIFMPPDGQVRTFVPLASIPPVLQAAVLSAEDRRFYQHPGFDLKGTARALFHNMRGREGVQGGSTITQQLARGLFLSRRRTLARKLQETMLAMGLEVLLSKREILEMYLNSVYFGHLGNLEIGGVAEGAHYFFDKPIGELTLPEAALLVGVIPAPNLYSPFANRRLARSRRNQVLRDMVQAGRVDAKAAARAMDAPLGLARGRTEPALFPYFTDYALTELSRHIDATELQTRGLRVFTTLDPLWQSRAERELSRGVSDLELWYGRRGPGPLEGAACLLEPGTGWVRAVVGGRDYRRSPYNRATQSFRQPGSAFKPVVYAAAFDRNLNDPSFTPALTVPDEPREFDTPEGPWRPRNDDGSTHPQVTLAKALAKSLNIATANLTERVTPRIVAQYAERLGIGGVRPVASVGLGTSELSLIRLTSVYATLQDGGIRIDPMPVRIAVDASGKEEYRAVAPHERIFQRPTSDLMVQLLRDVIDFGTGYALKSDYGFTRPAAGKTGTTDQDRDTWFVGFTPDVVCGVWLGYDLPTPLGETAAQTAAPLWGRVVSAVLEEFPARPLPEPPDLQFALIDSYSGGLATGFCPSRMRVPFLRGTAPTRACTVDHSAEWLTGPELQEEGEAPDSTVEEESPE